MTYMYTYTVSNIHICFYIIYPLEMLNGKNYTDSVLIIFKQNKILTNILLSWASTINNKCQNRSLLFALGLSSSNLATIMWSWIVNDKTGLADDFPTTSFLTFCYAKTPTWAILTEMLSRKWTKQSS